jgi:phosphoribosylaminoimidazole-succinocarboxamide synthase
MAESTPPLPPPIHSGKVRDLYDAGDGQLIMAVSDRISVFDVVLPTPIPDKGKILTRLSLFWFDQLRDVVPNHLITANAHHYPAPFTGHPSLIGRSMLVHALHMVPVECVARAYLAGLGTAEYKQQGAVCGIPLPPGLLEDSHLAEPIFTPTTKGKPGEHDLPMTFAEVEGVVGTAQAAEMRHITLGILNRGRSICEPRGIIVADTKVELGISQKLGGIVLGDEVLTPDSSRFWPVDSWRPGSAQPSFDKQPVRHWAEATGWDKAAPGPVLPDEIVEATHSRYATVYEIITGEKWR